VLEATHGLDQWELTANKKIQLTIVQTDLSPVANSTQSLSLRRIKDPLMGSLGVYFMNITKTWTDNMTKNAGLDRPDITSATKPSTLLKLEEVNFTEAH